MVLKFVTIFKKNDLHSFTSVPQKALFASLEAWLEAIILDSKTKKPHSIGESLVLPVTMKTAFSTLAIIKINLGLN